MSNTQDSAKSNTPKTEDQVLRLIRSRDIRVSKAVDGAENLLRPSWRIVITPPIRKN